MEHEHMMTWITSENFLRVVLACTGLLVAGHHFCASVALERAPSFVKLFLLPVTVGSGIGMAAGAFIYGSGVAMLFAVPAVFCMSITELMVWNAGAYISAALDHREDMKQKAKP